MELEEEAKQEQKSIPEIVKEIMPKEAGLTKVEFEGPDVAIYVKNVAAVYGNEQVIRSDICQHKKEAHSQERHFKPQGSRDCAGKDT